MQQNPAALRKPATPGAVGQLSAVRRDAFVFYTDVLDKEKVYTALSRQNGRLLDTLTMLVRMWRVVGCSSSGANLTDRN